VVYAASEERSIIFGSPCALSKTGEMKRKKQSSFCEGRVLELIKCEAGDKCQPAYGIVAFHHKEIGRAVARV
jgi:hypothetical protein